MNRNSRIAFLFISTAFLTFSAYPAWAGPPPNPTSSDTCGDTAGGSNALIKNNIPCNPLHANTAFGFNALTSNTSGTDNAAFGGGALFFNTTGIYDTALGAGALLNNTASYNTATGAGALLNNTTGGNNTANGANALYSNTTGIYNTANGLGALQSNTTGNGNSASGADALDSNSIGNYNTASGINALASNTTGSGNSANGAGALGSNTSGSNNTASGLSALSSNTTGYDNVANGVYALNSNTTGFNNVPNGFYALFSNTTGASNSANGTGAMYSNTTGSSNSASGSWALQYNTTGSWNTASGRGALYYNTTGSNNTVLSYAMVYNTIGNNNVAIGYGAGNNVVTGSNNIYLGGSGTLDESSTMRLGSAQTNTYIAGVYAQKTNNSAASVPVYIDSTGKIGTLPSSQRYKDDIRDMHEASRRLFELRPVTYHYKQAAADGSKPLEYGLIAEEVAKVYPDLVVRGKDGQIETVQYHKLTPMLLNEVQRLNKAWQAEKERNVAQDRQLQAQTQTVAELKQQMSIVQAQARHMETLAARLATLETKNPAGSVAYANP